MSNYDTWQQTFALAMCAPLLNLTRGTERYLQRLYQDNLPRYISAYGDWSIVWGPVIWKQHPSDFLAGPDNSWFVAYNPSVPFEDGNSYPTYVIAVAGTSGIFIISYDWRIEDAQVDKVIDWNAWLKAGITNPPPAPTRQPLPNSPYIAEGTGNSTYTLLSTASPEGAMQQGVSLFAFLQQTAADNAKLGRACKFLFTGHSLGGALAPTLALAMVLGDALPLSPICDVRSYPIAGPSPGNTSFAYLWNATFPAMFEFANLEFAYRCWNMDFVNALDIVPQAWCNKPADSPLQNVQNIITIYGSPPLRDVRDTVVLLSATAELSGTTYFPLQASIFTPQGPNPPVPTTLDEFATIAAGNHKVAYQRFVGVPPIYPPTLVDKEHIVTNADCDITTVAA